MPDQKRIGVVLMQLGGPDSREAVEPFLYNLFCDPDIIDFPLAWVARKPLARLISRRRAPRIAEHYQEIGGGSPILPLTQRQAEALEQALRPQAEPRVVIAMRYWHPFTREAVATLRAGPLDAIVLLPLYPQYSRATTGSSVREWHRCWTDARLPVHLVPHFYDHPLYVDAVVEQINGTLARFDRPEEAHLVFSAHGLPVSFVERGDPYAQQVEATVERVCARGAWPNAHTLCYQSKVGPQRWLEPSLPDTVHRLAAEKCRRMLVVPIAFVTDHIETLHEINIETRAEATRLGIEQFEMMPALNDAPRFIAALAQLVLAAVGAEARSAAAGK